MKKTAWSKKIAIANRDGANALLAATIAFLQRNGVSRNSIISIAKRSGGPKRKAASTRTYSSFMRAYEDMGVLMATWFSNPKFLDAQGFPVPLEPGSGPRSLAHLIKTSRVKLRISVATELMHQSPSVRLDANGLLHVQRRVFVLPEFEIPRAALIIERYLSTLIKNSSGRRQDTHLLLERSCYVPSVNLKTATPILRDIKSRATAFIDAVDGEIEGKRLRGTTTKHAGEMGVLIFAWTQPKHAERARRIYKRAR